MLSGNPPQSNGQVMGFVRAGKGGLEGIIHPTGTDHGAQPAGELVGMKAHAELKVVLNDHAKASDHDPVLVGLLLPIQVLGPAVARPMPGPSDLVVGLMGGWVRYPLVGHAPHRQMGHDLPQHPHIDPP